MLVRSFILFAIAIGLFTVTIEDASARGRLRFKRAFNRCGSTSSSSSWGGSYGTFGSSGSVASGCCSSSSRTVSTSTVVHTSFGSTGGTGGQYVSTGSSGCVSMCSTGSTVIYSEPIYTSNESVQIVSSQQTYPTNESVQVVSSEPQPTQDVTVVDHHETPHVHTHAHASVAENPHAQHTVSKQVPSTQQGLKEIGSSVLESKVAPSYDAFAYLVLRNVPSDADVYLVGKRMTAQGPLRRYRIPLETAGEKYEYPVEIRLRDMDTMKAEASATVSSGETVELWVSELETGLVLQTEKSMGEDSIPLASR